MKRIRPVHILYLALLFLAGCSTEKNFQADRKYSTGDLQWDYRIFRGTLEAWHPSLYWYTPKDSMDRFFDEGYADLKDSMTEEQFRAVLSRVIAQVDCGHTSVSASKAYSRYLDTARLPQFPLIMKFWKDTMVLAFDLNRRDTVLKRGTQILAINGRTTTQLTDLLFPYIVTDGYNLTGKYQYLSTGLHFSSWYRELFGFTDSFDIQYADTLGMVRDIRIPIYDPRNDTLGRSLGRTLLPAKGQGGHQKGPTTHERPRKPGGHPRRRNLQLFDLRIDSSTNTGFMTLNTFERGYHVRGFINRSFRKLHDQEVKNLVIDVRSNGGGDASLSTLLTSYLIDRKFKLADSLYAIRRHSRYDRYISNGRIYSLLTWIVSHKGSDGYYHYGHFERHYFSPRRMDHFDGRVYILTGGNSFSATCLFAGALKGQSNVTLVGEETGGGFYGNTAWMIPDVTLPITKVRFRLPRFRLVVDHTRVKDGRGVLPDVPSLPTIEAIGKGQDFKTATVKELIRQNSK